MAMEYAGYEEIFPITESDQHLWREVPNRKWYTRSQIDGILRKKYYYFIGLRNKRPLNLVATYLRYNHSSLYLVIFL